MYRETEWRMRVLLSIASRPGKHVEKRTSEGTIYHCEAIHFDGEGLVNIFRQSSSEKSGLSIQFSIYGQALGILTVEEKRERLLYEKDMGYGSYVEAEKLALQILKDLEPTITEEEAMSYYL